MIRVLLAFCIPGITTTTTIPQCLLVQPGARSPPKVVSASPRGWRCARKGAGCPQPLAPARSPLPLQGLSHRARSPGFGRNCLGLCAGLAGRDFPHVSSIILDKNTPPVNEKKEPLRKKNAVAVHPCPGLSLSVNKPLKAWRKLGDARGKKLWVLGGFSES